ncbi:MAG: NADH-ubiquinone oxidoreductase-F iron-sulfur binding region domain-containing protein [Solirubrobacteraceae bacterium]
MTLPRLLTGLQDGPVGFERHLRLHGELPSSSRRASAMVAELMRAGLRGRGGGEFPLATKLEAARRSPGTAVVLVNGCEGEPMSLKDRLLLESLPHLVLDGARCCAELLGTDDVVIAVEETGRPSFDAIEVALAARRDLDADVLAVPAGYVSGQETALVGFINGGPAIPRHIPPRVTTRGVLGRPTLVANPETLAHAALIARHGAGWFRALGTTEEPGSALVTLSGAVAYPGVFEIEYGCTLASLTDAAGGLSAPARALLVGGYAGTWLDSGMSSSLSFSRTDLRRVGASPGSGVIVALPQSACPVAEVTRVSSWLADQSAGQCGPCVHGLGAIADAMSAVCYGQGAEGALDDIRRWSTQVVGRGACAHPDGAARFVTSAVSVFADELRDHARHGLCDACERRPTLATPTRRPVAA